MRTVLYSVIALLRFTRLWYQVCGTDNLWENFTLTVRLHLRARLGELYG